MKVRTSARIGTMTGLPFTVIVRVNCDASVGVAPVVTQKASPFDCSCCGVIVADTVM